MGNGVNGGIAVVVLFYAAAVHAAHKSPVIGLLLTEIAAAAKTLGQGAYDTGGKLRPQNRAVQPADGNRNISLQPQIQLTDFKIRAAGKDIFEIFYIQCLRKFRLLLRVKTLFSKG